MIPCKNYQYTPNNSLKVWNKRELFSIQYIFLGLNNIPQQDIPGILYYRIITFYEMKLLIRTLYSMVFISLHYVHIALMQ